jgi:NADH-quinone oxidoreductase subunit N
MPPGFSSADFYYLLPELIVTGGALLLLAVDAVWPKRAGLVLGLSLGTLGLAAAALWPLSGAQVEVARGLVAVDSFALFFKVLFLVSAALTILLSSRYLSVEGMSPGEYYFLVICTTLGMMFMAGGIDLVTLFIGLETMAIAFYILVGYLKPSRRSNEAAIKYFLLGAFSLGILLYGMSLMYGLSGTTSLRAMAEILAGRSTDPRLVLAVILVVAGMGFKIAAVPFHMWAPDVYEGAPTPITAFLSVGSKAAAFAMLLRIFIEGLPGISADWRLLFYALSIVTMTVGNVAALTQTNLKRMLAYSSIAHAGYILMGVVAGTPRGITAVLVYLMVYTFMQLGAFAIITMLRREDTIGEDLKDLSGLHGRNPWAAFSMLFFMLSLGGIPPTAGFMGKFWLFGAAIEAGYVWLAIIGVVNSALSLYYYLRIVVFMYLRSDTVGSMPVMRPAVATAIALAMAATLILGVYPRPLFEFAEASARTLGVAALTAALR